MLFALICTDKPGNLQLRMDTRAAHLAFLEELGSATKAAGPFLGDHGNACATAASDGRTPYALTFSTVWNPVSPR